MPCTFRALCRREEAIIKDLLACQGFFHDGSISIDEHHYLIVGRVSCSEVRCKLILPGADAFFKQNGGCYDGYHEKFDASQTEEVGKCHISIVFSVRVVMHMDEITGSNTLNVGKHALPEVWIE